MDQEPMDNLNIDPEQTPAGDVPPKPRKRRRNRWLRRLVRRAYGWIQKVKAGARDKVAALRDWARSRLEGPWEKVKGFFRRIWAVIGPTCKKIGHGIAVAARAVWKVLGPLLQKLWQWMRPGFVFLGNKIKAGCAYLVARFKGLNKAMQIGIGAVSGSLLLLVIALMISSHVARNALNTAEASPGWESTLPVTEATEAPTSAPSSPTPVPEPLRDQILKKGDDSPTVALVQTRLMELGYMDSDEPTEHFGSITEAALIRFQRHNDISPDGQLGEGTWLTLMNEGATAYVMQNGDEGDDVEDVQTRLYELGYLSKSFITGSFGEKTAAAVEDFQKANGIKVDGKVGHETEDVLYDSDVVGNFFSKGEVNDTILAYQERLKKLGYLASDYKAKGKMDETTIKAIRKFQENHDLTPDGCLGPTTMSAMDDKEAKAYTLSLGMKGSDVKAVQKRLKALGYLTSNSEVTGYYGEATEDAVEEFQRRNGLSADGTVGPKTLEKLNSSDARKAAVKATPKPTKKPTTKSKATPKPTKKSGSKVTPKPTKKSGSKTTPKPTGKTKATAKATAKPVESTSKRGVEKLISIAESRIGCPYSGGAKGPSRFDCSGFVYWCMKQAGFKGGYMTSRAWRTTSRYTRITSMSSIKRGDILVFKGDSSGTGHVGIYLGGGKMIDASSGAGQVRVTGTVLSGSYWKNHFLMAYRIYD